MRTSTLVQATADVITVVSLRRGDVYKRLEEPQYGGETKLQLGVVTDVMNNGTASVITAVEFPMDYSGAPTPKLKTFGTNSDLNLFVAHPEEIRQHFEEVLEGARKARDVAEEAWQKARGIHDQVTSVIAHFTSEELTAPQTGIRELEGNGLDGEPDDREEPIGNSEGPVF